MFNLPTVPAQQSLLTLNLRVDSVSWSNMTRWVSGGLSVECCSPQTGGCFKVTGFFGRRIECGCQSQFIKLSYCCGQVNWTCCKHSSCIGLMLKCNTLSLLIAIERSGRWSEFILKYRLISSFVSFNKTPKSGSLYTANVNYVYITVRIFTLQSKATVIIATKTKNWSYSPSDEYCPVWPTFSNNGASRDLSYYFGCHNVIIHTLLTVQNSNKLQKL